MPIIDPQPLYSSHQKEHRLLAPGSQDPSYEYCVCLIIFWVASVVAVQLRSRISPRWSHLALSIRPGIGG